MLRMRSPASKYLLQSPGGSRARPYCLMLENVTIWGTFNFDLVKLLYVIIVGAPSASFTHSSSQRKALKRVSWSSNNPVLPQENGGSDDSTESGKLLHCHFTL